MAYQQQPPGYQQGVPQQVLQAQGVPQQVVQQQADIVSGEQYRYALTNFRIAHEKVEQQRQQLEEQERQVAQLRARIALLEGSSEPQRHGKSGNTVDDFSIRNAAAQLDKLINRWSADIVRAPPTAMVDLCQAIIADVGNGMELGQAEVSPMQLQCYLRHAMAETISEGIINCLIVTNSSEANVQLTRIHEHLFARDPTVACVWRRQTFSAAVETCTPDMSLGILFESVPELMKLLGGALPQGGNQSILESAYSFSRMLHGSSSGPGDAFYRAFVPELGSTLYPRQIELAKRCLRNERGEEDRVGATIFPGLVKVTRGPLLPSGQHADNTQTVVRRAQVICECAMLANGNAVYATSTAAATAYAIYATYAGPHVVLVLFVDLS
ncbi:hypothetical protein BDN72DRAFT_886508 [Pluteus cervinus]|uniref:Uncharacterized protein n=1 Tax=Pluteus cervinus TaxID=181527 RepID=A0ACD3BAU5_9AGAR|nr:hypothetical protein BDN72DRAFT_886508 [Pluteus cervinus]